MTTFIASRENIQAVQCTEKPLKTQELGLDSQASSGLIPKFPKAHVKLKKTSPKQRFKKKKTPKAGAISERKLKIVLPHSHFGARCWRVDDMGWLCSHRAWTAARDTY